MKFIKSLIQFIKSVANDERIPPRDKKVLVALLALIASPIDLIPDWIPLFGVLDDLVILAVVLDYFFRVLEEDVLLSHYPWGMKSFVSIRRIARAISILTPSWIRDKIWQYQASPYRK